MKEANFEKRESEIQSDSNGESTEGSYEHYDRNGIRNHDFRALFLCTILLSILYARFLFIEPRSHSFCISYFQYRKLWTIVYGFILA